MRTSRVMVALALLVLAVGAWTRMDARKEFVRLRLTSPTGAAVRVHVATHGLIILEPHPTPPPQPAELTTTLTTPVTLTLAGIGEANLEVVDPATTLSVDVTQVRANAPPVQRLTARAIRVGRATYSELYRVIALDAVASEARR